MAVNSGSRLPHPRLLLLVLVVQPFEGGATTRGTATCAGAVRHAPAERLDSQMEDSWQPVSFRQLAVGFQRSAAHERGQAVHAVMRGGAMLRSAAEHNASGLLGGREDLKEIFVLHVGKTGGTSVYNSLGPALASDVQLRSHAAAREELHTCMDHPDHRYVYFVRAPLHRYVSGWISRFRMGGRRHFNPWSLGEFQAFSRFRSPDELGCALNSSSAQRRASALEAMNSIQHVKWSMTNYWGGLDNLDKCVGSNAFVGRFEHMQEDYERLVKMLASRNALKQEPDATISQYHSTPAQYDGFRHLSERARANLQHWFRKDYELFDRLVARGLLPETYPMKARTRDEEVEPVRPVNWWLFRTTWMLAASFCVAVASLTILGFIVTGVAKGGGESWIRRVLLGLLWVSVLLSVLSGFMVVLLE